MDYPMYYPMDLLPSFTEEEFRFAAVRSTLEEIREIALQSKLLALNTTIESAQLAEGWISHGIREHPMSRLTPRL